MTEIVDLAERALRAFGGSLTREQAASLLPMWMYYRDLSPGDRAAVVARFRPRRIEESASGAGG